MLEHEIKFCLSLCSLLAVLAYRWGTNTCIMVCMPAWMQPVTMPSTLRPVVSLISLIIIWVCRYWLLCDASTIFMNFATAHLYGCILLSFQSRATIMYVYYGVLLIHISIICMLCGESYKDRVYWFRRATVNLSRLKPQLHLLTLKWLHKTKMWHIPERKLPATKSTLSTNGTAPAIRSWQ